MSKRLRKLIGFGGGCHWCTEAVFDQLRGVSKVEQGWIRSHSPHGSYSEAVRLGYDEKVIPLKDLLEIHLRTHSSTSVHSLRGKYRSAIYFSHPDQVNPIQSALTEIQGSFDQKIITPVLPLVDFRMNQEEFLDYFKKKPEAPFCKRYIHPKLNLLRERYDKFLREKTET
ncbi:peptide-methionine (S)-S-oxide reductase [Algoriphagus namhaensis]